MIWRRKRMRADIPLSVEYASLGEPTEFTEEEAAKGFIDYSRLRGENILGSEYSSFEDRQRSMQYGTNPFSGRFEEARFFYDIYVPRFEVEPAKKSFTILLRLLNPAGLPVSEEQEILIQAPKDYEQVVPAECWASHSNPIQAVVTPEADTQLAN